MGYFNKQVGNYWITLHCVQYLSLLMFMRMLPLHMRGTSSSHVEMAASHRGDSRSHGDGARHALSEQHWQCCQGANDNSKCHSPELAASPLRCMEREGKVHDGHGNNERVQRREPESTLNN